MYLSSPSTSWPSEGCSGRGTQYIPTGRNGVRPRGSRNRPRGFSVDV